MKIKDYQTLQKKIRYKMRGMIRWRKIKIWDSYNYKEACRDLEQEVYIQFLELPEMDEDEAIEKAIENAYQYIRPTQCRPGEYKSPEHIQEIPFGGQPLFAGDNERFDIFEFVNDKIISPFKEEFEDELLDKMLLNDIEKKLSGRKLQIFQMLRQGYKECEIAKILHLNDWTVRTYKQRIKKAVYEMLNL